MELANGEIVRLAAAAMGTRFEIVLPGKGLGAARLRSAGEAALAEVVGLSDRLSAFAPGSSLSYINANAADRAVPVDRELFDLLVFCREGWRQSGGAFDITVGPLMEAWGFRGRPGGQEQVDEARRCVGMANVELDAARGTVRFARPGMRLDLGAVAKGYALDVAACLLRSAGVDCALMHGGTSSVIGIGAPDADGWRIRVGSRLVTLRDRALSVSAPRGRLVVTEGGLLGHVLDPRTGVPTVGADLACALSTSAAIAEVWSTALLVLKERPVRMPADIESIIEMTPGPSESSSEVPDRTSIASACATPGTSAKTPQSRRLQTLSEVHA